MNGLGGDRRGVAESTGVVILIGITILVTGLVGLNVVVDTETDDSGPNANFSYDHIESNDALIITHTKGDEFPAGDLVIDGDEAETTWAEAANTEESEQIGPGDIVQIGQGNSYGKAVREGATVRIFYEHGENRTQLSEWP